MRFFKNLFQFYIQASIHVSLAVIAFVYVTAIEFEIKLSNDLLGFVFLGTILGYNLVKYARVAGMHHRSLTRNLQYIQILSFVCFVALLFCAYHLSGTVIVASIVLGMLTFLYGVPLILNKNLRSFSGLKIFIVAVVWSGVTVWLPYLSSELIVGMDVWLTFIQRMLLVVVLTLPFEIRDLPFDDLELKTIPQILGVQKSKILGIVLLFLVLTMEGFKDIVTPIGFLAILVMVLVSGLALVLSNTKQSKYYASFVVESIPLIWLGILVLLEELFR